MSNKLGDWVQGRLRAAADAATESPEQKRADTAPGMTLVYTLLQDEKFCVSEDGHIVVVHPDHPPKIINADGTITVLDPTHQQNVSAVGKVTGETK